MAKKPKVYVVWVGKVPGIYHNWREVQSHVQGFPDAKYMSFNTVAEAEAAYGMHWEEFYSEPVPKAKKAKGGPKASMDEFIGTEIDVNSIAVDAACSGNPGVMEYRGVQTITTEEIFHSPIFKKGTNNIGEFLAIVHALALYSEKEPKLIIYTDSRTAMAWVANKKVKTSLKITRETAKVHQLIQRGEKWLKSHRYSNPIIKWETERWGEIPADFGRK